MQKQVSKQSLAIVALSILIAISMALTATFAAFSADATVSGRITYTNSALTITVTGTSMQTASNGVQVTVSSNGSSSAAAISVTLTDDAFEWSSTEDAFALTTEAKGILDNYTITISSDGPRKYYYSAYETTATGRIESDVSTGGSVNPSNGVTADISFYLGGVSNSLIKDVIIRANDGDLDAAQFEFAISAAYYDINY